MRLEVDSSASILDRVCSWRQDQGRGHAISVDEQAQTGPGWRVIVDQLLGEWISDRLLNLASEITRPVTLAVALFHHPLNNILVHFDSYVAAGNAFAFENLLHATVGDLTQHRPGQRLEEADAVNAVDQLR